MVGVVGDRKLACVMVGLPARGKSYISQKICRYLQWMGTTCQVFNVGQYRRRTAGANCRSDFFDPANKEAVALRNEAASLAIQDMVEWLQKGGEVAIYDATNTTRERRKRVLDKCTEHGIEVLFVETICHDPDIIVSNIAEVKVSGPDYQGMDAFTAAEDFKNRMRHYEKTYETVAEESQSFVKLINVGSIVVINLIKGWLQSRIVYYVMNLHVCPRRIYLSRHGESEYNVLGKIGGDANLSPRGRQYAQSLPGIMQKAYTSTTGKLTVWTSTLRRTIQTSEHLPFPKLQWKALDELDSGVCDGMTYEEIEEKYPEDYADRDNDKLNYRYRGGESYRDLVLRLEPIIMELERQKDIMIIGHQAVIRALYAYYMNYPQEELPYIKVPLHTVICLTPRAYGCDEERYRADIEAVDTHRDARAKPSQPTKGADVKETTVSEADAKHAADDASSSNRMKRTQSVEMLIGGEALGQL
ncbi:Fructose-2,6-bisphosphatase [Sorochytrium milnesiophthora]